jgi:hypothetical protein
VIDSFRIGSDSGWLKAQLETTTGYPGLSETYRDWTVSADCGEFQGSFLAVLTDTDVAAFFTGLVAALDSSDDGEDAIELGSGRGCAATVTVYRFGGLISHGIVTLTPKGDDPIPCLTMWLDIDPAGIRVEASRVLAGLS